MNTFGCEQALRRTVEDLLLNFSWSNYGLDDVENTEVNDWVHDLTGEIFEVLDTELDERLANVRRIIVSHERTIGEMSRENAMLKRELGLQEDN